MSQHMLESQEQQTRIAQMIFESLAGQEWQEAIYNWVKAGDTGFTIRSVRDPAGRDVRPRRSRHAEAMDELKLAMADAEKGAWLSAEVSLQSTGRYRFTFNYDRRAYNEDDPLTAPRSGPPFFPDDDAWREEFRRFPRSPEYMPVWAREIVGAGPVVEAERSALVERALAVRLVRPDAFADVLEGAGWSAVWGRVDVTVREHLADDFNRELLADYRDGGRGYDGFWQEIYGAVTRGQPEAGAGLSTGGLEAELVAVGRLDGAAGDEDRAAAVEEVLTALIENQIRQRLDMS